MTFEAANACLAWFTCLRVMTAVLDEAAARLAAARPLRLAVASVFDTDDPQAAAADAPRPGAGDPVARVGGAWLELVGDDAWTALVAAFGEAYAEALP